MMIVYVLNKKRNSMEPVLFSTCLYLSQAQYTEDCEGSVGDKVSKEGHRSSRSPQHRGGLGVIASMCMLVTV